MDPIAFNPTAYVDTLRFRLAASRILPRTQVRVSVVVNVLVSASDIDHDALEQRVRGALSRFIDASWTVSRVNRTTDASGFERVQLNASAQISVRDNYNLEERARLASKEGVAISEPSVDSRLPGKVVGEATLGLQEHLLEQAQVRMQRFSEISGRTWRIGDIQFGIDIESYNVSPKLAVRETALLDGATEDLLTTSERLMLVAQVTLKSNAT